MVNTRLLEETIRNSGMTMVAVAEKSGILRETLYNKLRGTSEFKASEITNLSKVLIFPVIVRVCEAKACKFAVIPKYNNAKIYGLPRSYIYTRPQ